MRKISLAVIALLLLAPIASANPGDTAMPNPSEDGTVIQAEGDAQIKVQNDFLTIDMTLDKEGVNLSQLHEEIQKEAASALDKASGNAAVTVKTSGFSIYPVYDKDRLVRHHASYQISLETKEFDAGLSLAGAMLPFQVRNLSFSVSPERRKATEKMLLEQAISDLRDNLTTAAKSLGNQHISIINLSIGNRLYSPIQPQLARDSRATMGAVAAAAPVTAEAGESQVSVSVSGSAIAK